MDERADCTETPERKTNVNNGRSPTLPFLRPSRRETEGHDEATRDLLFLCDQHWGEGGRRVNITIYRYESISDSEVRGAGGGERDKLPRLDWNIFQTSKCHTLHGRKISFKKVINGGFVH